MTCALSCLASPLAAQGVPTHDNAGLAQLLLTLRSLGKDAAVQKELSTAADKLSRIKAEQLAVLERITSALSGSGIDVSGLEHHASFPVSEVYPIKTSHPMDTRLFLKDRQTVEKMIVIVASEFASAPGIRRVGLSPTQWRCLFQALIKQESRFSVSAQSPVGAYGLTQLMPGTAADLGVNRYDVMDNLRGGARYITTQLNTFGAIPLALAAYNAGPGNVRKYGGVPPFKETQGYVRNISRYYNEYLAVVGGADTVGTLTPSDMALAEYSNTSDASRYYAADAHATTEQVVNRLAAIIRQIDAQPDVKSAVELNSYARAELARILTMRIRLKAADQVRQAAHAQHLVIDRLQERTFMNMEVRQ